MSGIRQGRTAKSELEHRYCDEHESHGTLCSSLVREYFGVAADRKSGLAAACDDVKGEGTRLRTLLRRCGIDPETAYWRVAWRPRLPWSERRLAPATMAVGDG